MLYCLQSTPWLFIHNPTPAPPPPNSSLFQTSWDETAVCYYSICISLVVKLNSPEVVWAGEGGKTCPSHPSLPGRLPTTGGTAVWAVTPACQPWPLHLLLGCCWQGHLWLCGTQQPAERRLQQTDWETQNAGSEGWKWYFGWKWVWDWSWFPISLLLYLSVRKGNDQ